MLLLEHYWNNLEFLLMLDLVTLNLSEQLSQLQALFKDQSMQDLLQLLPAVDYQVSIHSQ